MFSYEIREDVFETYVLSNKDRNTYLEVVPCRGGIITNFVIDYQRIFYVDQSTLIDPNKIIRGGNPILFPICGFLENNMYQWESKAYYMSPHGFARDLPWNVVDVSIHTDFVSIRLELTDNPHTYKQYPFQFKLTFEYQLSNSGLKVISSFHNQDTKTMPFNAGFHPYFYVEDKNQFEIEIPSDTYEEFVKGSMVNNEFNYENESIDMIYKNLQSNRVYLIDRARNVNLTLLFDELYKYIVVWSLKGKSFICVEPWIAYENSFHTGNDLIKIQPGERKTTEMEIKR